MTGTTSDLPEYITAEQLAACELSADDGLQLDLQGGISREDFLQWFSEISRRVAKIFTGENF